MLEQAKAWNSRLLKGAPSGFALDARHTPHITLLSGTSTPHITLLQRYVHTAHHVASAVRPPAQLDAAYATVGATLADVSASSLELTAVKPAHMEMAATLESVLPARSAKQAPR